MTFQEIYEQIVFETFGDSSVNNSMIQRIRGTGNTAVNNGLISQAHRRFQGMNNFWFMMMTEVIQLQIGIQSYTLSNILGTRITESNIKEIISLLPKDEVNSVFKDPLLLLRTGAAQNGLWQIDGIAQPYPEYYEMFGDELVIYPDISESHELHFIYYGYTDRPPVDDATFTASNGDAVTLYAGDIIVHMVQAEIARIKKDMDSYRIETDLYNGLIQDLKFIDNRKRHANITELPYIDC